MRLLKGKFQTLYIYKLIFALFNIFLISNSLSQEAVNPFQSCKEKGANYRKYGNNCYDNCLPQFDKSYPCFKVTSYGCDCGDNQCFYEDSCIKKADFEEIYLEIVAEKEKAIIDYRKKLVARINKDPKYSNYIKNIYKDSNSNKNENKSIAQQGSENYMRNAQNFIEQQKQNNKEHRKNNNQNTNVGKAIDFIAQDSESPSMPMNNQIPQFYIDRQASKDNAELKVPVSEIEAALPIVPIMAP